MKLEPEFKAKWVAALRSGKYKQGRRELRSVDDEFCCLGVAIDITHPETWELTRYGWKSTTGRHVPPVEFYMEWGLDGFWRLSDRNDGEGEWRGNPQTFAQIADWIEAEL